MNYFYSLLFCLITLSVYSQDDLMKMLEESAPAENTKVFATFKATKIINAHTIETVKKNTLDFRITHRFGNVNTGIHGLYGFDSADNIRFSFDYGITDKLMIGIGRSKLNELIDGSVKYRFLEQTTNNKMPVSVAVYGCTGFTPKKQTYEEWDKLIDRLSYCAQLIIARKFGSKLSLELLPTFIHRNYVSALVNPSNGAEKTNDIFALGTGGRIKITRRSAFVFDYYYTFSKYRMNNPDDPYYMPLSIGYELETGGHVFHINFTNSSHIVETDYIHYSDDSWLEGGFKMGFNISRVFTF